jgi:hypothetical protein
MKTWTLPWLFPVGLLVGIVLISLSSPVGYILAGAWAWVVFPHAASYLRAHSGGSRDADEAVDYWRTQVR